MTQSIIFCFLVPHDTKALASPRSHFHIPCFIARGLGNTTDAAFNKDLQAL